MSEILRKDTNQRMSQIVVHNNTVYLSGQVGNKNSKDVATQTSEVLEKIENGRLIIKEYPTGSATVTTIRNHIEKLLLKAGSNKNKLLSATIYLSDISYFEEMNRVWDNWLPENSAPARATVEAKLAFPEFLVEICIIATT